MAEFTQHIAREKVLSLRSIATPQMTATEFAGDLDGALKVAEAADIIEAADAPFRVLDADGTPIGQVSANIVIDVLIGRTHR